MFKTLVTPLLENELYTTSGVISQNILATGNTPGRLLLCS